MKKHKRILLLEDDRILTETLGDLLESRGFEVLHAGNYDEAMDATFAGDFDILVLDVNLPGRDGFAFLGELREAGIETPAIFITARTDIDSLARGFEVGADDYLKKPFDFAELLIRMEALFRKSLGSSSERISVGEFEYDISGNQLYRGGECRDLPPSDLKIVRTLFARKGETVSKEELLDILSDGSESSPGALRVHISKLRKLGLPITTLKGIGYRLEKD